MEALINILFIAILLNMLAPLCFLMLLRTFPSKILVISVFGGLLFYVGVPLLAAFVFLDELELPKVWLTHASKFSHSDISTVVVLYYLLAILAAIIAFILPSSSHKLYASGKQYPDTNYRSTLSFISFLLCLFIAIGLTYKIAPFASHLFSGYRTYKSGDAFGSTNRSALAGFTLMTLSAMLITFKNDLCRYDEITVGMKARILLSRPFFYFWLTASIALISIGTRQYLVISATSIVMALLGQKSGRNMRILPILLLGLVCATAIGVVGTLRTGQILSLTGIFSNIFLEPLFTFYTTFNLANAAEIPFIAAPTALTNGMLNLIPSVLFPDKTYYYIRNYSTWTETPFGAVNWMVSLLSNFGLVGGTIFVFLVYFFARKLYSNRTLPLWIFPLYCMLPSLLMFNWMRDPWDLTLKIAFEYGVALPFFLAIVAQCFDSVLRNYKIRLLRSTS